MQSIFKYDVERLQSYATNIQNNIQIACEEKCLMLSFPEVQYFNYAFRADDEPVTQQQIKLVKEFYKSRNISRHKVIVAADCEESNAALNNESGYKLSALMAKTIAHQNCRFNYAAGDVEFIKVTEQNLECFTHLYLQSFESLSRNYTGVINNFRTLLNKLNLQLFILKYKHQCVGINVLYNTKEESFLAGGAILPQYRNRGFHKIGLSFRIQLAMLQPDCKRVVTWAYKPGISLQNMLKLSMMIQQEFNVYEYCI